MKFILTLVIFAISSTASSAFGLPTKKQIENKQTSITIYSKATPGSISPAMYRPTPGSYGWSNASQIPGYAVIRQERDIYLQNNRNLIKLDDVAAYIDPTTVAFKSFTAPDTTSAIEQNFYFDMVSPQKLAERYIGKEISFEKIFQNKDPEIYTGTLLSTSGFNLAVQKNDGSIITTTINNTIFPDLPGGLYTKPTLVLDIESNKLGKHHVETSYQTEGITWWADYNAIYSDGKNENEGFLDLGAWVSIVNKSGASYDNTKLKLIAGDVNRVTPSRNRSYDRGMVMEASMAMSKAKGFAEKSFFEFHLYTLGRPTTLPDNSTKQIELFEQASNVPVEKLLVYNGNNSPYYGGTQTNANFGEQSNKKVEVYLKFKNEKSKGLGMPLPAGKIRVSKRDEADGSLEFIGENTISHTPKDEEIKIKLGNAFDVVGERKQRNFQIDHNRKYMSETVEITVRNHKDKAVNLLIVEKLNRAANWKIYNPSSDYKKIDSRTVHFPVKIAAGGSKTVTFDASYSW